MTDEAVMTPHHTHHITAPTKKQSATSLLPAHMTNLDRVRTNFDSFDAKVHSNGGDTSRREDAVRVATHNARFAYPGVPNQDYLEQVVVFSLHFYSEQYFRWWRARQSRWFRRKSTESGTGSRICSETETVSKETEQQLVAIFWLVGRTPQCKLQAYLNTYKQRAAR